ncbi:MAG: hypothetical protein DRO11_09195 [Methanobacteriota archaeon]|nr:MAG: hypothetical protein DRO11_09195 [Euryarchaeota archaeon]
MSIILPEKVLKEMEKVSRREDALPEEIVGRAVIEFLKLNDPEMKAEIHENLCDKYLKDVEELMKKGNYVQASEKAWGAASQMLKAEAARRGVELRSHPALHRFVITIARERGAEEIRKLCPYASMLHQNFYETWLPKEMVAENIKDVKDFIKRLREGR